MYGLARGPRTLSAASGADKCLHHRGRDSGGPRPVSRGMAEEVSHEEGRPAADPIDGRGDQVSHRRWQDQRHRPCISEEDRAGLPRSSANKGGRRRGKRRGRGEEGYVGWKEEKGGREIHSGDRRPGGGGECVGSRRTKTGKSKGREEGDYYPDCRGDSIPAEEGQTTTAAEGESDTARKNASRLSEKLNRDPRCDRENLDCFIGFNYNSRLMIGSSSRRDAQHISFFRN